MTRFSKIFVELIGARTCQELAIHPESCFVHCLKDIPLYLLSNFKYFVPICLLPLLIKLRSLNKNKLRHTFKYYAECSLVGAACGCGINALICFLRYIFGHFGYTTIVYWPSVIGGCLYNLGSERVKTFFETSVFQCITETFFLKRHNFVSHLIADSKYLQTYIFMICSALILQGKYLYGLKGFWFLQPNPKIPEVENTEHTTCQLHPKISCQRYLGHGMRKYFFLGLTLDVIKAMLSRISKTDSAKFKILSKIKNFRIRSTALLTTYIGIYRFTHCYLNRRFPHLKNLNHIISAFLAGFCYNFYPQLNIFSYALIQAIFTLWKIVKIENFDTDNEIFKFLQRIPFASLLFPFALGKLVHYVCLKPEYCSPLTFAITNGVTNNYPNVIKNELKAIIQKAKAECK